VIGVYEIRNLTTGECYIGMSKWIAARWSQHLDLLGEGKHPNRKLQFAWQEHGEGMFAFRVLEITADEASAGQRESRLIAQHRPEYNGGGGDALLPIRHTRRATVREPATKWQPSANTPIEHLLAVRCPCCNNAYMVMFDRPEPYLALATEDLLRKRELARFMAGEFDPPEWGATGD